MINCEFENGNKASLRHVTIDALVINETQDKLLLEKRAEHLISGGKWCLPGGFLERDETTRQAIKREIKEETGYEVSKIDLFRINDKPDRAGEDRQNVTFVFLATALEKTGVKDDETEQTRWFGFDELPSEDDFAFDHYENIELLIKYRKEPFNLPMKQC